MEKTSMTEFDEIMKMMPAFLDYLHEFYGAGGIYDMGATHTHLCTATMMYISSPDREQSFEGDSFDREQVRSILEDRFGLEEVARPSEPYPVPEDNGTFIMKLEAAE